MQGPVSCGPPQEGFKARGRTSEYGERQALYDLFSIVQEGRDDKRRGELGGVNANRNLASRANK